MEIFGFMGGGGGKVNLVCSSCDLRTQAFGGVWGVFPPENFEF